MARARSPNRDKAFQIYKDRNGEITNREIAEILNKDRSTISRNRKRLINLLVTILFPQTIQELI